MEIDRQHIYTYDSMVLVDSFSGGYTRCMERLFVFSDLHGDVTALTILIERAKIEQADHLICTGDVGLERLGLKGEMLFSTGIPISIVRGNCDSPWIFADAGKRIPPQYDSIPFGKRKIFFTHGHLFPNWQAVPITLKEEDIFISGHTHRASLTHPKDSPILLNPGSVSSPRDRKQPSYAIIKRDRISIHELSSGSLLKSLEL